MTNETQDLPEAGRTPAPEAAHDAAPEAAPSLTPEADMRDTAKARPLRGPARYVLRALVLLILVGFLAYILQDGMRAAFMANPGLNGLIIGVALVGALMALGEFWRIGRAAKAGRMAQETGAFSRLAREPLMAPLGTVATRGQSASGAVEALSVRLDEGRETLRYVAGLLVFLGLLGTFWGLLETVSSVGGVIKSLRTGAEAGVLFDELKSGLAAPLAGMGLSFSSSLFGIAGSLIIGFLDLQVGGAQRRLRTDVEDWLATLPVPQQADGETAMALPLLALTGKLEQLSQIMAEGGGKAANAAMANLAEGIQGLVQHMRGEQQLIRDWVESQAERERKLSATIERLSSHLAEKERG